MKAALYLRVSTDKQEAQNQEQQLRALCEARGWEIYNVYRDVASGMDPARLAFNKLMHDARTGKFKLIVFWSWSRITRRGIKATFTIMDRWREWKVKWESLQEPFLSTMDPATAELVYAQVAWSNAYQRRVISEATKAGLARLRALGIKLGRPVGVKETKPRRRKGSLASSWDELA